MPGDSTEFAATLKKLGLWSTQAHDHIDTRPAFKKNLAELSSDQIATEHAYWSSEAGRISELHGFLTAQKVRTDLNLKVAQAQSRNRVRNNKTYTTNAEGKEKKLTQGEVNDLAEADSAMQDARKESMVVETTLASVSAAKEATLMYLSTISREITRRGDMLKSRL